MKKLTTIFAALFLCLGMAQAQDAYYSGNSKIWKNDSLLYNLTDSINIQLKALQVAENGTTYGAGYTFDTAGIQGRIWMNDSCVFTGDTNTYFDHLVLTANGWTAAGFNNVWQNGELLYSYSHGEDECHIQGLAVDTTTVMQAALSPSLATLSSMPAFGKTTRSFGWKTPFRVSKASALAVETFMQLGS